MKNEKIIELEKYPSLKEKTLAYTKFCEKKTLLEEEMQLKALAMMDEAQTHWQEIFEEAKKLGLVEKDQLYKETRLSIDRDDIESPPSQLKIEDSKEESGLLSKIVRGEATVH